MVSIQKITAREILSSGSTPSIEVKVVLDDGSIGIASVPFGASAGIHEAFVLFDGDKKRYGGKGMLKAVTHVHKMIAPLLVGKDPFDQKAVDTMMITLDGTPNKERLGANAILGVSVAVARAAASSLRMPLYSYIRKTLKLRIPGYVLPAPMMVCIEGGKHADQSTDLQEYMIASFGAPSVKEAVRKGIESYLALKSVLKSHAYGVNVGNEGAFAPAGLKSNEEPLQLLMEAITKAGYVPGKDAGISIDPAISEVFQEGRYRLPKDKKQLDSAGMIDYFVAWAKKYPAIISMEDCLHQDDWDFWPKFTKRIGDRVLVVGDDLTVTNPKRLQKALDTKSINAILIKLNQIGTLTETVECCMLARKHGCVTIISHRGGGETNDTAMIDLAVAVNASFVKVGPSRGERVEKYNRLMEIEDELEKKCSFIGKEFRLVH
ncbi:phosphopyruvate hydratase [Candidatus Woesearchaeota archaeon]|nr:phosphopyruvate hydratase [Candidatus Woesearchaeota archaeon]